MALEKRDAIQIVSLKPPLPQKMFQITAAGSTTEATGFGGSGTDGRRYGYFTLNTSWLATLEGMDTPPIQPGEKFQVYDTPGSNTFPAAPGFPAVPVTAGANQTPANPSGAPDLVDVSDYIAKGTIALQDPTICTVAGVVQVAPDSWNVYFLPYLTETFTPLQCGIVTIPEPYEPRWFGDIGHVASVNLSWSMPGGPDQLTFTLQVEPNYRDQAFDIGRIIQCFRGGSCIWEGQNTEPQPSATGWNFTVNGCGTYGSNYAAYWQTWNSDNPVDLAISRGMRWQNPGIGSPAGIYLGPVQDPGSLLIADFMSLLCTGGSLMWQLVPPAGGCTVPAPPWVLQVKPAPTDQSGNPDQLTGTGTAQFSLGDWHRTDLLNSQSRQPPDLYLVNTNPVPRTLNGFYNTIIVYYMIRADTAATSKTAAVAAEYGTVLVDQPSAVAEFGRIEYYLDVSNAGVLTKAQATAIGQNVLTKYIRANFASAFTVQPGQLLNNGGVPVDLGCNWGGKVVTVQGIDANTGGEVAFAPVTFMIGEYTYDDDSQTATVAPYQSVFNDITSVAEALYPSKLD